MLSVTSDASILLCDIRSSQCYETDKAIRVFFLKNQISGINHSVNMSQT